MLTPPLSVWNPPGLAESPVSIHMNTPELLAVKIMLFDLALVVECESSPPNSPQISPWKDDDHSVPSFSELGDSYSETSSPSEDSFFTPRRHAGSIDSFSSDNMELWVSTVPAKSGPGALDLKSPLSIEENSFMSSPSDDSLFTPRRCAGGIDSFSSDNMELWISTVSGTGALNLKAPLSIEGNSLMNSPSDDYLFAPRRHAGSIDSFSSDNMELWVSTVLAKSGPGALDLKSPLSIEGSSSLMSSPSDDSLFTPRRCAGGIDSFSSDNMELWISTVSGTGASNLKAPLSIEAKSLMNSPSDDSLITPRRQAGSIDSFSSDNMELWVSTVLAASGPDALDSKSPLSIWEGENSPARLTFNGVYDRVGLSPCDICDDDIFPLSFTASAPTSPLATDSLSCTFGFLTPFSVRSHAENISPGNRVDPTFVPSNLFGEAEESAAENAPVNVRRGPMGLLSQIRRLRLSAANVWNRKGQFWKQC
jgi:hypothetical protein